MWLRKKYRDKIGQPADMKNGMQVSEMLFTVDLVTERRLLTAKTHYFMTGRPPLSLAWTLLYRSCLGSGTYRLLESLVREFTFHAEPHTCSYLLVFMPNVWSQDTHMRAHAERATHEGENAYNNSNNKQTK